jgi:hypothetical protein
MRFRVHKSVFRFKAVLIPLLQFLGRKFTGAKVCATATPRQMPERLLIWFRWIFCLPQGTPWPYAYLHSDDDPMPDYENVIAD